MYVTTGRTGRVGGTAQDSKHNLASVAILAQVLCIFVGPPKSWVFALLQEMAAEGELLFPAIDVNGCVTKSTFDNVYECRPHCPMESCVQQL